MPKFGFYFKDVIPWSTQDGASYPGEDLGCELAWRRTEVAGESEVYIKCIQAGGPAALSGRLAVGDVIAEVNGADPRDKSSGAVKSLSSLLDGQQGAPVWLKTKKATDHSHVTLIRQHALNLSPAPSSGAPGGLGFSFVDRKAADFNAGVEVLITEIKPGGAMWLAGHDPANVGSPLVEGDVITHVDGRPTTGATADFKGPPFSRVLLTGRKGIDEEAFDLLIVRMVQLPQSSLGKVGEYMSAVASIPPAPPSDRVNGSAEIQMMATPLINGLDIKQAAQIVVAAYIVEEIESSTPGYSQSNSDLPSSPKVYPTIPPSPLHQPSRALLSPTLKPQSPLLRPTGSQEDVKGDGDEDTMLSPQQESSTKAIGDRVSPGDIVSSLSPEVRFNALAMACAIAAPSLMLHKKLRKQALKIGDLPRVPERRESLALKRAVEAEAHVSTQEHAQSTVLSAHSEPLALLAEKDEITTSAVVSRSHLNEAAKSGPKASPGATEEEDLPSRGASMSSWTGVRSSLKRASSWMGVPAVFGEQSPDLSPGAFDSPSGDGKSSGWGWSAAASHLADSGSAIQNPSRWRSWMGWNRDDEDLEELEINEDERLLWHDEYMKLLSGFMVVHDGRTPTLLSILNSKGSSCTPFANYILESAKGEEIVESLKSGEQTSRGRTASIVPECTTADSDDESAANLMDDTRTDSAEIDAATSILLNPDTLQPFSPRGLPDSVQGKIVGKEDAKNDKGKCGGPAVTQGQGISWECDAEGSGQASALAQCTPCVPGVQRHPWTICWLVLAASVGSRHYDARARAVIRHMSQELFVPWQWIRSAEIAFCKEIIKSTAPPKQDEVVEEEGGWNRDKIMRYGLIGGGAVAGGVVLAVTGGLAAPAIVAGLGLAGAAVAGAGVVGAGAAGFAASVAAFGGLSTALGVSFGAAGAGLVGYKMHRRTGDVKEFEFELVDASPGLPVTIGIHGWINNATDSPWKIWGQPLVADGNDGGESYAIRWETAELRTLGQAISNLIESQAQSYAFGLAGTAVLGAAFATIALPLQMMSMCDYVDNSWSVVQQRADKAGEQLARTLLARVHGNRPVTLIGYGMGARVIIKCLLALAESPAGHGIVETAVLMGTPYPADSLEWSKAASVCAYRLVNAFNSRDWLLGFAYRATSANISGVAGLKDVDYINGSEAVLENIDLCEHLTASHFQYRDKLQDLVQALGAHTGIVNLNLITQDPGQLDSLVSTVKNNVPSFPPQRKGGFRETAANTLESMKFWKLGEAPLLQRSSSNLGLSSSIFEDDEMMCAKFAAVQTAAEAPEEFEAESIDLGPRPHSR